MCCQICAFFALGSFNGTQMPDSEYFLLLHQTKVTVKFKVAAVIISSIFQSVVFIKDFCVKIHIYNYSMYCYTLLKQWIIILI